MTTDAASWDPAAEAERLFDRDVTTQWDATMMPSRAWAALRDAVTAAATGQLDDTGIAAAARQATGDDSAARALAAQCRAVVRAARPRGD